MPEQIRDDDRTEATESKFYLPVGYSPSTVASQLEEVWASIFDQRVKPRT